MAVSHKLEHLERRRLPFARCGYTYIPEIRVGDTGVTVDMFCKFCTRLLGAAPRQGLNES